MGVFAQCSLGGRRLDLCVPLVLGYQVARGPAGYRAMLFQELRAALMRCRCYMGAQLGLCCRPPRPSKVLCFFVARPPSVQMLPAVDFTSSTAAKHFTLGIIWQPSQRRRTLRTRSTRGYSSFETVYRRACDAYQSAVERQHSKRADSCETRKCSSQWLRTRIRVLVSYKPRKTALYSCETRAEPTSTDSALRANSPKSWTRPLARSH